VLVIEPTRELALQTKRIVDSLCAELPTKESCVRSSCSASCAEAALRSFFAKPLWAAFPLKPMVCGCCAAARSSWAHQGGCVRSLRLGTSARKGCACWCAAAAAAALRLSSSCPQIIDEADALLTGGFVDDMAYLYASLPVHKQVLFANGCIFPLITSSQVLAFSATYSTALLKQLRELMLHPQEVLLCKQTVALKSMSPAASPARSCSPCAGAEVRQAYVHVLCEGSSQSVSQPMLTSSQMQAVAVQQSRGRKRPCFSTSSDVSLSARPVYCLRCAERRFLKPTQALVFSNNRAWIEALAALLTSDGFPAAFTCGACRVTASRELPLTLVQARCRNSVACSSWTWCAHLRFAYFCPPT